MARARKCATALSFAVLGTAGLASNVPDTNPAAALRSTYAALAGQLAQNQFQQPLYLESAESARDLKGDIYALVDYPFATVKAALNNPENWCDVLILHLNTKYCRAVRSSAGTVLAVSIGKKDFQRIDDAHRVDLAYRVAVATPDYLEIQLSADEGPLATSDYRIRVKMVPVDDRRTFLQLTYSYAFGAAGRLAMQAYLATIGRGKVGFTVTAKRPDGQPDYIGGVRGVVERNTMRYYLAIDAFLSALGAPPAEQLETRLKNWHAATERYPRQLREIDRGAYLSMKQREVLRQQTAQR